MTTLVQKTLNDVIYWELQPDDPLPPATPIALFVHWMSGNANSMRVIFDGVRRPLRAVSLQGRYPSGDPLGGYSWHPDEVAFYNRSEAEQAVSIRSQADHIATFLRDLKQQYPAQKTVVSGMSQGGDLTLALAAYYPDLLDFAIPVAGRLSAPMRPTAIGPARMPRVIMKSGVEDPIVSIASAREVCAWLQSVGYDAELMEYANTGHTLSDAMINDIRQLLERF
jgi:predicted esterase